MKAIVKLIDVPFQAIPTLHAFLESDRVHFKVTTDRKWVDQYGGHESYGPEEFKWVELLRSSSKGNHYMFEIQLNLEHVITNVVENSGGTVHMKIPLAVISELFSLFGEQAK